MNNRRLSIIAVAATVGVAAVAGLGWLAWNEGREAWWSIGATWQLDDAQQAAVTACGDPGWMGMLRVLQQDLDVACSPAWFARTAQPHLVGTGHKAKLRWLHEIYATDSGTPRTRYRAGHALLLRGEAVPGFALLSQTPSLKAARQELVQMVSEGELAPESWADPALVSEAALHQLDDDESLPVVVSLLRHESLFERGDAERRAWMVESALERVGLGDGLLEAILRRRAEGLPVHDLTPELAATVVNQGEVCRERSSAKCLALAADLLEAHTEAPGNPDDLEKPALLSMFWAIIDAPRPRATAVRQHWFAGLVQWVGESGPEERAMRIVGMVTGGPDAADAIRRGEAGDPSITLRRRSDGPWMSALVALSLGDMTETKVSAVALDSRVGLDVGGVRVVVDSCGRAHAVPAEATWPEPLPKHAILAQATAEAAHAASRRGDVPLALRLQATASRWDPVGVTELAGLQRDAPTEDFTLGRAVAAALSAPVGAALESHHAERQQLGAQRALLDHAGACGLPE